MKKLLILTLAICLSAFSVNANEVNQQKGIPSNAPKMTDVEKAKKESPFDQKLGLTDEQKQQAKELRVKSFEKIKPIMTQLKAKEQEVRMIKNSKLAPQAQQEKLNTLYADIKVLRKEAHDIRIQNMKDFESILTADQKKTLKEMKKEGKKHYKKGYSNKFNKKCKPQHLK
ncbi:MAG: Spy/CpxP family protein refolding chaperone [bacterium]|nr:Spy/CpxP family protein refolding chaperone [bacterium]